MALQEQNISYKFAGGIETKMDSKAVPATRLLALENGVFTKAISIQKRNGYEAYARAIDGVAALISDAKRLGKRDRELLLFTPDNCYSKQTGANQWTDVGAVVANTGYDRAAVHTSSQQTMPDHATLNGVTAYAWEDSRGGVYWTTVDESGAVYRAPTQADANGQRPRCLVVGDTIHIYYAVPTSHTVMVLVVNPSTPAATVTPQILIDDFDSTNPVYDACVTSRTGTPGVIAWREYATDNLRVGYVNASGELGAPANGLPSVARVEGVLTDTTPLGVAFQYVDGADDDRILVTYVTDVDDGAVRTLSGGTTSLTVGDTVNDWLPVVYASSLTTDVLRAAICVVDDVAWVAFECDYDDDPSQRFCVVNSYTIGALNGDTDRTLRSVGLVSRAFTVDDNAYAVFVHDTTYFNVYLTYRLSDFADAGRHLSGSATGAPTRTHLSSVHVADSVATVTLPYKTRVESASSDKFTESALRQVTLNFANEDAHQTAQIGRGLYLAAACPQHYDGRQWTEQGFHVGPEYVTPTIDAGGAISVDSTYLYRFWYEWTDAQGEIHRGPVSFGTTVETGPSDTQVTFELPTLRVTRKENVRICAARSLPGDSSRLWRITSLDPTTQGDTNGYVANDKTVDTVFLIDEMSDDDLQLQEPIYTTGGILSNDPVTLGSIVAPGKNRLFFTDASDGSIVRFSQRIASGFGLEVAPELMHDVDPYGGDITALAVMDDVVYAFKASCIFAFNGNGPLENGTTDTSGFSATQIITSDVGCSDPSSVVLTPDGLMFKSAKGIYLLDRSRQVSYVGASVEAYNDQDVRRADVLPGRTQVVFLTSSGMTLLYDYRFGQWSTFTNHEGYDSVIVNDEYHYLRTNDVVFHETVGEYSDAGSRITLRFETAWLHLLEHLQGFQRFWYLHLLGTWVSPHQLGIQYRTDYAENWSDPAWLDATGDTSSAGWLTGDGAAAIGDDPITGTAYGNGVYGDGPYGGTPPDVYQWKFGIHEKGQSIQFRFEDFEKNGLAGASFELTEMTIIGGVNKAGTRPTSGARST